MKISLTNRGFRLYGAIILDHISHTVHNSRLLRSFWILLIFMRPWFNITQTRITIVLKTYWFVAPMANIIVVFNRSILDKYSDISPSFSGHFNLTILLFHQLALFLGSRFFASIFISVTHSFNGPSSIWTALSWGFFLRVSSRRFRT